MDRPDWANQLEPYFFIQDIVKVMSNHRVPLRAELDEKTFYKVVDVFDYVFTKGMKVYNFSKELVELVKDSKLENYDYIKMPFPYFFINNKIYFEKHRTWLHGILVIDNNYMDVNFSKKYNLLQDNLSIFYIGFRKGETMHGFIPNFNNHILQHEAEFVDGGLKIVKDPLKPYYKDCYNFIYSLVNLLTTEHEDLVSFKQDNTERNIKREKKGKQPIPNYRYIKLGGKTLAYAKAYSKAKSSVEFKTYVQGFFRTYKSDRYVNMQGKTQWIFPFVKGADLPERPELQLVKVSATNEFMERIRNGK